MMSIRLRMPMKGLWIAVFGCLLLLSLYFSGTASAANTTYYVDNRSGSNCSDSGSGTSTAQPFCSFTPINNIGTFGPGDQILLARGASWNAEMVVQGTGNSGNWITIGAYGSGAKPIISRNGNESDRAIRLTDPDYWRIQDLEISYAGTGILVGFTSSGHEGLEFKNIYVHHIKGIHQGSGSGFNDSTGDYIWNSAGIELTVKHGYTENPWNGPVINNVLFDYIKGDNNLNTIRIDWFGGGYSYVTSDPQRHDAATNVVMNHLDVRDADQGGGMTGCDDSMAIKGVYGLTIMNSVFDEGGKCYSATGTATFIMLFAKDVNFFNNVFTNVPDTGSPDQVAIDYEHSSVNVNVNNNYFGNHAGAGPSILAFNSYIGPVIQNKLDNLHIDSNVMVDNGASIRLAGSGVVPTGRIGDNFYSDSTFTLTESGSSYSGMTVTNNRSIAKANIYPSGYQFSGTQGGSNWSYQAYDGSSWSNLAYYDSSAGAWQTNSSTAVPNVRQFEQTPGTSGKIARAWIAPSSGTISLRGRLLKSDYSGGDGIVARITKNGTRIWPSGGDQFIAYNDKSGVEQVLDNLSVSAGDVIRFEVDGSSNNTADTVSWSPSIAYTAFGGAPGAPTGLSASGGNGQVYLSWNAVSGATSYEVKRGTSTGVYGTTVVSNHSGTSFTDTGVSNGNTYYYVVTASNGSGTSGYSTEASATPTASGSSYAKEWTFDSNGNMEGWTTYDSSGSVSSGSMHLAITGGDPYIISPDNLGVAASNGHVYIRMQNNTGAITGELFFTTNADTSWSAGKALVFDIDANSGYTTYDVDMSAVAGWSGTIKQIRIDINQYSSSGSVDIDAIRMGGSSVSAPGAPTGLSASGGNGQVSLSWNAVSGADSYTVKRGTSTGTYGTTVVSNHTSTSYIDTGVSNGTTYYYVVTATNSGGTSGNSAEASATPTSGSSYAKEWNFNTDSDMEGWSLANQLSGSVSGGVLALTSSGTDPYMFSSDNLGINAGSNGHVYVRLKNNSSSTGIQVYFITNSDTSYGESKVVNYEISSYSDYAVYDLDMSANANWTGTIKQIRFDPANAGGTIEIDYIRIGS